MTNQCKSGVAELPVRATSMSQGHTGDGVSETGKQQSLRPYRERTHNSTDRSHGKAESVVASRRLLVSALKTGGQLTFSPVSWRWHERRAIGVNLGDLAVSMNMTGRGGVAVAKPISDSERVRDELQGVGGGNSIDDGAESTTASDRSAPALCSLVPKSRVCHSPEGYEA